MQETRLSNAKMHVETCHKTPSALQKYTEEHSQPWSQNPAHLPVGEAPVGMTLGMEGPSGTYEMTNSWALCRKVLKDSNFTPRGPSRGSCRGTQGCEAPRYTPSLVSGSLGCACHGLALWFHRWHMHSHLGLRRPNSLSVQVSNRHTPTLSPLSMFLACPVPGPLETHSIHRFSAPNQFHLRSSLCLRSWDKSCLPPWWKIPCVCLHPQTYQNNPLALFRSSIPPAGSVFL